MDDDGSVGWWSSLALDSSDRPHISYLDWTNGNLKYARWDGSNWQIETVDDDGTVGMYTSIALDSGGRPHISYYDIDNANLKYARWDGSNWQIETVDSAGTVGYYSSLVLDSSDRPHISYMDWSNRNLKYALWDGSNWHIETVDSAGDVGRWTSLALDSNDRPHISYYEFLSAWDGNLKYARWDGTAWQIETVDDDGWVGRWASLVLDSSDRPHISYLDWSNRNLKCARWDGSDWHIETVDDDGDVGEYTSIALDSSGQPHISYYGVTNLKYAWFNMPPPSFSLLSPGDDETVTDWPLADWEDAPDYPTTLYDLWYSTDPDFATYDIIEGLDVSEYQFTEDDLDRDTTYHWKVRATDGYFETWSNETWSFHVAADASVEGVELTTAGHDNGVLVSWTIDGETPLAVRLLRGAESPVVISGKLPGHLTGFLDMDVEAGNAYTYWLEVVEQGGATKRFGPTEARVPEAQHALTLHQPWPSPARDILTIAFELSESSAIGLHVYDLAGRRVATLATGEHTAGRHELSWDCAAQSPGVYLLRLETAASTLTRRIAITR